MGKDNAEIKPITLGGYSADAVLGKASGLSPNMANIRFDLFQGINSILGNTAYNPTQCPGSYNLGGDVFQYVRRDQSYDVVLSRMKANSAIYTAGGSLYSLFNQINTTNGWNLGTPTNGDNLFNTSAGGTGAGLAQSQNNYYLNLDFEDWNVYNLPVNWTATPGASIILKNTDVLYPTQHGNYYVEFVIAHSLGNPVSGLMSVCLSNGTVVATISLQSQSVLGTTGWVQSSITQANLASAVGQSCYILFTTYIGSTTSYLQSLNFTYYTGNVSAYSQAVFTAYSAMIIDNVEMDVCSPVFNYGEVPTTFGNIVGTYAVSAGGGQSILSTRSSANGSSWSSWNIITNTLSLAGSFSYTTTASLNNYYQYKFNQLYSAQAQNVVVGAQWLSQVQTLLIPPNAWGTFQISAINTNSGSIVCDINTSQNGSSWHGWILNVQNGATFTSTYTGTLGQFIQYRITQNITNANQYVEVDSIGLNYNNGAGSGLNAIAGFAGTGWNQYFAVLNNYMVISDGTTTPCYWAGSTGALAGYTMTVIGTNAAYTTISAIAAPSYTYPAIHYNRLFGAYNTTNTSRIWWCEILDPTTWFGVNLADINTDDGDIITGIYSYAGCLYVFKRNMPYQIQGNNFDNTLYPVNANYTLQPMPQLPGCEAHRTIVKAADGNLYWYSNVGIVQWGGTYLPNMIGRGFVDNTIRAAGFGFQNTSYNLMNAVDFVEYNEVWFSFGHTIYAYNYAQNKWSRYFFDNSPAGNNVYSLTRFQSQQTNNILSFTGQNIVEQWNDANTFYMASLTPTVSISIGSYYQTDFLDGDFWDTKDAFSVYFSIKSMTALTFQVGSYWDYSANPTESSTVTCPTTALPDEYQRVDIASGTGRRMSLMVSCNAYQFGISDMAISTQVLDSGRR